MAIRDLYLISLRNDRFVRTFFPIDQLNYTTLTLENHKKDFNP